MPDGEIHAFLTSRHPYDALTPEALARVAQACTLRELSEGEDLIAIGARPEGIYLVRAGAIELRDEMGAALSLRGPGNSFGDRALLRGDGMRARAVAVEPTRVIIVPETVLRATMAENPDFARLTLRGRDPSAPGMAEDAPPPAAPRAPDLSTLSIAAIMTADPDLMSPDASVGEVAAMMRDRNISCVLLGTGRALAGIVTTGDLASRVLASGLGPDTPARDVMTADPMALTPEDIGLDALHIMAERRVSHLPVVDKGAVVGIITQTDLVRREAMSAARLVRDVAHQDNAEGMAAITAQIPKLLAQLVAQGARPDVIGRMITDIADAATRRLLALAEAKFGPPPVPYLWLACGSQGRQEQTGVSDQDNCLILSDDFDPAAHDAYFTDLAGFVCDGLDACGYVYCPGDMMATNPRWRQPVATWRGYFAGWVRKPDPMAQMLASVMFDLRPIGGDASLFEGLQAETLEAASRNSIFVAHMTKNALSHSVPLGLFRGFALIRSGEHKNRIDLKHAGVVPVVDLGRLYAIIAKIGVAGTRARLAAAREAGATSKSGAADLLDAYDLIAETRLRHQAAQVRRGEAPDNFMDPSTLSELERNHLRDAFLVIRTMQSAAASGRGGGIL